MHPLTDKDIRASFVNTSKRETREATLPDLDAVRWDDVDYLGWHDAKRPRDAFVVLELDDVPTGILLRTVTPGTARRKLLCAWCQDVKVGDAATMYVAPRAGAAGRRGDTIGTAICGDFSCSANVRRDPSITEMSGGDEEARQFWTDLRVAELRERSSHFVHLVTHGRD